MKSQTEKHLMKRRRIYCLPRLCVRLGSVYFAETEIFFVESTIDKGKS